MEIVINTETKTIHCNDAESLDEFKTALKVVQKEMHKYSIFRLKTKKEME